MTVRTVLLTVVLIGICFSPAWAGLPAEGGDAETIASYEKAIIDAKDKKEEALPERSWATITRPRKTTKAAEEFVKALSESPPSPAERLQMATAISWADRPDDAIRVLQSLLAENQQDRDARIHLARVLSWSDRLQEAQAEADIVLKDYPENQDALLVKANTLRWRGEAAASIPVYEKALAQGENFDVRIGLASAYLAIGKKETAKDRLNACRPFPTRKKLQKFQDALCATRPAGPGIQYSYYKDSDDNRENRYALFFGFWVHDWESEVRYDLFDAVDPVRREKAEDVLFRTYSRHGTIGTGAGLGVIRTDSGSGNTVIGHLKADFDLGWGTVGVSAAREVLTDTAQLIENEIVKTSGALFLSSVQRSGSF
jgi:thioredoxin-like negative regulator of GroEL